MQSKSATLLGLLRMAGKPDFFRSYTCLSCSALLLYAHVWSLNVRGCLCEQPLRSHPTFKMQSQFFLLWDRVMVSRGRGQRNASFTSQAVLGHGAPKLGEASLGWAAVAERRQQDGLGWASGWYNGQVERGRSDIHRGPLKEWSQT